MNLRLGSRKSPTVEQVCSGTAGSTEENPIDAVVIGAGPSGMVALRVLLRDDPPLSVMAIDRQKGPGGIWTGHIPAYSTLQDLKCEYQVHGVKFPQQEPPRRAPRDQVAEFCEAYHNEFGLKEHVLWQHDVTSVEMVKPMLHKVKVEPFVDGLTEAVTTTIFTRSVLVCTGHNIHKYVPQLPGQETATFPIRHNNEIRDPSELPTSDIIVIGAGPSAMDMVQEACITQKATNVHVVARIAHWGAPDMWWPWMWQFGWSELHLLRVLYRILPLYVVDALLYYLNLIWAIVHGIPEWRPPVQDPVSSKVAYILRTHLLPPYKKGQFKIHNDCRIKLIDGDKVTLTDGTVIYPKMIVAATGWSTDSSFLPGGAKAGEYDSLAAADIAKPFYLRFYDQEHPGIFYISMSNGFMAYTENASFLAQAINQILRGTWTPPSAKEMEKNCREVVLHHIGLPGRLQTDLEEAGFKDLRTKNVR
ncbi:hypothetical protein LTS15_009455 [Exophiala xenobiotica]|nr:hypothetical protein LTS15_009455 [Exophiala xenobiotica]